MEAEVGIEPTNDGFANHCLTTWRLRRFLSNGWGALRRRKVHVNTLLSKIKLTFLPLAESSSLNMVRRAEKV